MVQGKPIAITDEDLIPLLVLSDEFGFQELSDACQGLRMIICFGWQMSSARHRSGVRNQGLAHLRPGFVQQNSFVSLLNRCMRKDTVPSDIAWNGVLALLKIWFVQPNSLASLLNRGMRPDGVTGVGAQFGLLAKSITHESTCSVHDRKV
jgi:hypothetical protein